MIKGIFIHHTAVSWQKNPKQWPATDAYHAGKGWGGGGYNMEIAADGEVHTFRKDGQSTAAQYVVDSSKPFWRKNLNDGSFLSIALDGNFDVEEPTDEQVMSLWDMLKAKMEEYGLSRDQIHTHSLVSYKTCPGKLIGPDVYGYLEVRHAEIWARKHGIITTSKKPYEPILWGPFLVVLYRATKKILEWARK